MLLSAPRFDGRYPPMTIPPGFETWTDHDGIVRQTPTIRQRLKFVISGHRALRAFVFRRDRFTCVACGAHPRKVPPPTYDGRTTVSLPGPKWCLVMDHVISRQNGGIHHPSNLQTMCSSCNTQKIGLVDARHPVAVARQRRALRRR